MGWLAAGDRRFDVDLVIFDKDGTLFDFASMWLRIFQRQVELLVARGIDDPALLADIYHDMGYDPDQGTIDPNGPLALATYDEIRVILALALYRHGRSWPAALGVIAEVTAVEEWPALEEMVQPLGDLPGLFAALAGAGIQIGVVTTDSRAMTAEMLRLAGVLSQVSAIVCADDELALKPAPDGIVRVCEQVGVAPARATMVGDSPIDLIAAAAAGVGACVGVTSGVSRRAQLEPLADVVIASIRELRVEGEPG